MQNSEHAVEAAARIIETKTKEIEGFFHGVTEKVKRALEALGAFEWFKEGFAKFSQAEEATIRLKNAIEATGRVAAPVIANYQKLAAEISHHTLTTKMEVLALAKQAEQMGFTGKKAERLIEEAIGLGTAMEMGAEHAMTLTIALERGNVQMLRRIPQLHGIKDATKLVRQAELLMAQGLKTAGELSKTASGQITHLTHGVHELFLDLGGLVAKGLIPIIDYMRKAVDWFKSLDKATRTVLLTVPGLIAAFYGLGPILGKSSALITPLTSLFKGLSSIISGVLHISLTGIVATLFKAIPSWTAFKAAINGIPGAIWGVIKSFTLFSVTGLIIAGVAGGIYLLVQRMGGLQGTWDTLKKVAGATWDYIKQKTAEFIEYVQPITDALVSLWNTAWPMIQEGASELWDAITDGFQTAVDYLSDLAASMGIDWGATWDSIRDALQTAVIFMEFSLKNFKAEANLVWTGIAAGLMESVDFMKDGFISLVATGAGVGASLLLLFTQLWDAIKHPSKAAFKNIGIGLTKTFTDAFDNMAHDLGAGESPLTKQLKEDYEKQKGILSQSFEDFKKQKLAEFALNDEYDDEEETKKEKAAKHDEHRRQEEFKALAKFDQALSNSAEAQARIAEQKDRLDPKYRGNNFEKSQKPEGSVAGSTRGSAESLKKMDESKELLRQIVKNTSKSGDTTKLEPANLGW